MNQRNKNFLIGLVVIIMAIAIMNALTRGRGGLRETPYSEFLNLVKGGKVTSIQMTGQEIQALRLDGERFITIAPKDPTLVGILQDNNVKISARPDQGAPWYVSLLVHGGPFILIIAVWIFFMRRLQGGGNKLF